MFALGLASLFFTAVSVVSQLSAGRDSKRIAEGQKKTNQAERALAEIRNRRAKVEELRKGRIERARIISAGEASGASKSSGVLGGAGSVQAQTASNIGFLTTVNETSKKIFESRARISDISGSQGQKLAFASITGTLGQTFSPGLKEVFK